MLRLSLLNKDLKTMPEKIMDKVNKLNNEKKENDLQDKPLKLNKSYDNILSKSGLGNTMRGSNEVINHQNNSLKESTMGISIPIKQIILEFTADHIRDNAGKYAAGTMLGLGTAAGYLAGDPEHGAGLMGENSPVNKVANNFSNMQHQSDFQKDLAQNSSTTSTNFHNQDKGVIGNLWGGVKQGAQNLQAENKFNDLTDAQKEYEDIKNNDGALLTSGQKAALGAGALGAGFLATKMRRR